MDTSKNARIEYLVRTINQIKENGQTPSEHLINLLKELEKQNESNLQK